MDRKKHTSGMGRVSVGIYNPPFGGLMLPTEGKFDITASISLWEPYMGSGTFSFSFELYECASHAEYSGTPLAQKTVTVQKSKDEMFIGAYATFTVNVPADPGVYIYKVATEGALAYEAEFPILTV